MFLSKLEVYSICLGPHTTVPDGVTREGWKQKAQSGSEREHKKLQLIERQERNDYVLTLGLFFLLVTKFS